MWWIGDWLRFGEQRWGQMYDAAQRVTGYHYDHVRSAKRVAETYKIGERSPDLSWRHHHRAAALPQPERNARIRDLAEQGYSQRQIAREVGVSVGEVNKTVHEADSTQNEQPDTDADTDDDTPADDAAVFDSTPAGDLARRPRARPNASVSTGFDPEGRVQS